MNDDLNELTEDFDWAKWRAREFILAYNRCLPSEACPHCAQCAHVPGLPCPECGYEHPVSFLILLDGEYGYEAVEIRNRRQVVATFEVSEKWR